MVRIDMPTIRIELPDEEMALLRQLQELLKKKLRLTHCSQASTLSYLIRNAKIEDE